MRAEYFPMYGSFTNKYFCSGPYIFNLSEKILSISEKILSDYSMLITNKDESFRGFIGFYVYY